MRGFVIAMISLALIVALVLTGVLVLSLTGNMPSFGFLGNVELELANRQVYSASDFDSLSVAYSSERVTLLPGKDGEVVLEEYMSRWDDEMLASVTTSGRKLDIRAGQRQFGLFITWQCSIKVYVPREYLVDVSLASVSGSVHLDGDFHLGSLDAKSTSGSVRADGVTAEGDIRMTSSSGGMSAASLVAGGDVVLKNTSGSIKPGRVQAKTITADNSSGSIRFDSAVADTVRAKNTSGSVAFDELQGVFDLSSTSGSVEVNRGVGGGKASSSSGSVRVQMDSLTGNLEMRSTSGSCRLTVPHGTGFSFGGKTTSGSIKTPEDNTLTFNKKGNEAAGNIGGGGSVQVWIESSSGSVRVEYE